MNKEPANNSFQHWLEKQGYYRQRGSLVWRKGKKIVNGKELSKKLDEWKSLIANEIYTP